MNQKTIDIIACRLANGEKAVRTRINNIPYIIRINTGGRISAESESKEVADICAKIRVAVPIQKEMLKIK